MAMRIWLTLKLGLALASNTQTWGMARGKLGGYNTELLMVKSVVET